MAITDENGGMNTTMLVGPTGYGNNGFGGFGGDGWWFILVLLCGLGGWGMGGMGGGMNGLYPWMNQADITTSGFQNAATNSAIASLQNSVTSGFGDVQTALCSGFAGVTAGINNGFAQAEIAENARQMANMNQMFGLQSQLAQCCFDNRAATQDLKYTIATEENATRTANSANTQAILDKLCQLELDGYKREADQLRAENGVLKNQGFIANEINQQNEVFYNRLKSCPVNAVPVAGNTPLFSCNPSFNTPGCGYNSCGGSF